MGLAMEWTVDNEPGRYSSVGLIGYVGRSACVPCAHDRWERIRISGLPLVALLDASLQHTNKEVDQQYPQE